MLKIDETGVSTSKRVYFRMFLPSLASVMRRARVFARSCSLLSKYLPISWKQRKEQSHAQCHVTHRIRIFDKISEHVKVAKSVDIAVPELAVTKGKSSHLANLCFLHNHQNCLIGGTTAGTFLTTTKDRNVSEHKCFIKIFFPSR